MKIVVFGFKEFTSQICFATAKSLKLMGHEVDFIAFEELIETYSLKEKTNALVFKDPLLLEINHPVDLIFIFQTDFTFRIKSINNAPVIYYHTEYTWYPSCINPDFILAVHPEMERIFERFYPPFLKSVKDFFWFKSFIIPEDFKTDFNRKRKWGLHWIGMTCTEDHYTPIQRKIYDPRAKIVGNLQEIGLLESWKPQYTSRNKFIKTIAQWEMGLVVDGTNTYFSPRAIELSAAGTIPVIYVGKDHRIRRYYEDAGFINEYNCFMFHNIPDLQLLLYTFDYEDKSFPLRKKELQEWAFDKFGYEKKFNDLFDLIKKYDF
ncbi:MAG: hypothetical protein ACTSYF_03595 [Promethearchaeota archaeon]